MGVEYQHRAKEPNLSNQGMATIVDNATKNANAADALLSELEQAANTTHSPRVAFQPPILRVTKGIATLFSLIAPVFFCVNCYFFICCRWKEGTAKLLLQVQ